jgi:hypothetical protein
MANKKDVKKASNKIVYIFFLVGLVILLLVGFLYYQSQRPNYRDLEKTFSELTIPEGWIEVSSSSNEGTLGLFCWQIEGEECPYKIVEYKIDAINHESVYSQLEDTSEILKSIGYGNVSIDNTKCTEADFTGNKYSCKVIGTSGDIRVAISINSQASDGVEGSYAYISLSTK